MTASPRDPATRLAVAALVLAALGVLGSLGLTMVLGLKPCPLCFYQRAFAMAVLAVLGVGLVARVPGAVLCALAVPLAVAGLGVASFHVWLEASGRLDCPDGFFALGTAPKQSLMLFLGLTPLLLAGAWRAQAGAAAVGLGATLGLFLAAGSSLANGPMPPPKPPELDAQGKPVPLTICVPHYTPP